MPMRWRWPPRELVRVAAGVVAAQADGLEVVADPLVADRPVAPLVLAVGLGDEALADEVAHGHPRVQRGDRVLEDDLHPAAHALELVPLEGEDVLAVEHDLARGRRHEPEDGAPEGGLAAARLADEAQGLAAPDLKRHVVDGVDVADRPPQEAARGSGSTS